MIDCQTYGFREHHIFKKEENKIYLTVPHRNRLLKQVKQMQEIIGNECPDERISPGLEYLIPKLQS